MSRTQHISKAWSDLHPGDWVRLVTPGVVRMGEVLAKKNRSLNVRWTDIGERALPDAKHYFAAWKMREWGEGHMPEYYLEIIPTPAGKPDGKSWGEVKRANLRRRSAEDTELLGVDDVVAIVGLDPKSVRRRLRSGSLPGFQEGSRWRVARRDALALARKLGR